MARQTELLMPCLDTFNKVQRGKNPPRQECQNPALPAYLIGQSIWPFGESTQLESTFLSPPNPYKRNNCLSTVALVPELSLKQNSSWESLRQHQRYETTILWVAEQQRGSQGTQNYIPSAGLERRQKSALVPRPPIRPRYHLLQDHNLPPRWFTYKIFWHW